MIYEGQPEVEEIIKLIVCLFKHVLSLSEGL